MQLSWFPDEKSDLMPADLRCELRLVEKEKMICFRYQVYLYLFSYRYLLVASIIIIIIII